MANSINNSGASYIGKTIENIFNYNFGEEGDGTYHEDWYVVFEVISSVNLGELSAKVDEFIKPISKYEVKCYVGDTIPIGDTVTLKEVVCPEDIINKGIYVNKSASGFTFSIGEISVEAMGYTLAEITGLDNENAYPWYWNTRDDEHYAVFEVVCEENENSLCLTSPNGTVYKLTVDSYGNLSAVKAD